MSLTILEITKNETARPECQRGTTWLQRYAFGSSDARFSQIAGAQRPVPVLYSERLSGEPHFGGYDSDIIADRVAAVFPDARILVVIREQTSMAACSPTFACAPARHFAEQANNASQNLPATAKSRKNVAYGGYAVPQEIYRLPLLRHRAALTLFSASLAVREG